MGILVAAAAGYGCGHYESCDPDQVLRNNVCFAVAVAVADAGTADVAPGSCDGGLAGWGESCGSDKGCGCGTDICAKMPSDPVGFCSHRDCLKDPSVCAPGWTCTDFSAFEPGFSMCIKKK